MSIRARRALRALRSFYSLRSGHLLLAAVTVGLAAVWIGSVGWLASLGITLVIAAWATIVPIRLESYATAGPRLPTVSSAPASAERAETASTQEAFMSERRAWLAQIEVVRSEVLDLLRSERISTDSRWQAVDDAIETLTHALERGSGDRQDEIEAVRIEIADLRTALDQADRRAATEASNTSLSIARLRPEPNGAHRLLVVLSPQRCGSTWLYDQLRLHPDIRVLPLATVYRDLGVSGRRYPGDLSATRSVGEDIEVSEGVGGRVPALRTTFSDPDDGRPPIALEKIHPYSVDFDAGSFIQGAHRLRDAWPSGLSFVHLTREPLDAMRSFASYQMRSDRWHPDVPRADIPDLYIRSYAFMREVRREFGGPVISFEQLQEEPEQVVTGLYEQLLPERAADAPGLAAAAVETTSAGRRKTGAATRFFNSEPGAADAGEQALVVACPNLSALVQMCGDAIDALEAQR